MKNRLGLWWMRKESMLFVFGMLIGISFSQGAKAEEKETEKEKKVLVEVTVTGAMPDQPVVPRGTRYATQHVRVTEEQIEEQKSHDFLSALRNVPGVMFQSKNLLGGQTSHSLYIRGRGASHPSADFAVLFDGVPRFGALFGQVLGDGLSLSTMGGIEVYKSPQPAHFGTGYALVNVLPKYLREEGQEVELAFSGGSYATFDQSLSGGIKRGPFDVFLSQSWVSTEGHRAHSRAQQQSYYANAGYQINDHWGVRFLANSVSGQTVAPMPDTTPTSNNGVSWPGAERYDTDSFLSTMTLHHSYERWGGTVKAYWNDTDFDLLQELNNGKRYGNGTGGLWSRQAISLYGVRAKEIFHLWPGGEMLAAVDVDRTDLGNTQRTFSGAAVSGINGGLAERRWNYPETTLFSPSVAISHMIGRPDRFHLVPSGGYRYFHHNEFQSKSAGQGGVTIGYRHTDLYLSYARGVNYPSPVTVMNMVLESTPVSHPDSYWKTLKPEVTDHYEAGLSHAWPKRASVGANVFYDRGKDRYQAYMFGSIPTQWNDPIGRYRIRGLELTGAFTPAKTLEVFAASTWLRARAVGSNGLERDRLPYTPGLQVQTGATWTFHPRWRFYMDLQHLRDVYQGTSARSGTFQFGQLTESSRLEDSTLMNARLSYRFAQRPWRLYDPEIYLTAQNLLNRHYEYARGYPMPGTAVFAGFRLMFR